MAATPTPFHIHVPDDQLEDLRRRLRDARIVPNEVEDAGLDPNGAWAYGTDKKTLESYVDYWLRKFDWRAQEAKLNKLPHFMLAVNGLQTHFIHQRSENANAIPLLLVHGWPGSVVEFLKLLPLLKEKFHVVAPSIPGYAWSEAPKRRGGDCMFMAEHFLRLMQMLGYSQFAAQGGDWGAIITSALAYAHPEQCVALHVNLCVARPPEDWYGKLKLLAGMPFLAKEEEEGFDATQYFQKYETAYQQIQGTKPQSLGYGLNDSPVGLLAWILEKFQSWSDCRGPGRGSPEDSGLTKDEILTNVMVYWTTQSIASSFRLYYETFGHHPHRSKMKPWPIGEYVAVPTGVLWAKEELYKPPRHLAMMKFNIKHWSPQPKGGHFFAFEKPEVMAADIIQFLCEVIDFKACKEMPPWQGQGRPLEPGKYLLLAILLGAAVFTGKHAVRSRL